jgi:hypothetical protein
MMGRARDPTGDDGTQVRERSRRAAGNIHAIRLYLSVDTLVWQLRNPLTALLPVEEVPKFQTRTDSPTRQSRRAVVGGASALAATLACGHRRNRASAQEATPTADPIGIDSVLVGWGGVPSLPGTELLLLRTTMAPGGVLPPHVHEGPFVIAVESGTWGYTPQNGSVKVTRMATDGNPGPTEDAELDVELILTKGDFAFIENASQDWMRNAGDDDLVLFIVALNAAGKDFGMLLSELEMEEPAS